MRYILTLLMTSALAFGLACQSASSSTETKNESPADVAKTDKPVETDNHTEGDGHEHDDEAPRISLADAKKDFDSGEVVFIDTRSEQSYQNEHVKGAINVPAGQFEATYKSVPKDKKIIAYCS